MGIYFVTVFCRSVHNKSECVVLAQMNPIIEAADIERGYILKEELVGLFGGMIDGDITDDSRVIQYMSSTLDSRSEPIEQYSLPIRG
jgi:hypothetical protein